MPAQMSILSPTGHLGFTPIERGSFDIGVSRRPDAIVADSGSCDIGPQPLGADEHCSPAEWQRHDLELMLLAARRLGVPMIVGSASDAGTDRGVHQYAEIIRSDNCSGNRRRRLNHFHRLHAGICHGDHLAKLKITRIRIRSAAICPQGYLDAAVREFFEVLH